MMSLDKRGRELKAARIDTIGWGDLAYEAFDNLRFRVKSSLKQKGGNLETTQRVLIVVTRYSPRIWGPLPQYLSLCCPEIGGRGCVYSNN